MILAKPIVLRSSLTDMTSEQREQAERFLQNKDIINGGRIVSADEINESSTYGSEAVIAYRESLGLPNVAIYEIIGTLERNERVKRLIRLNIPAKIMINEIRMLQEEVDQRFS